MRTLIKILTLVALVAGLATLAIATNTDDSTVTITFSEIAELAVSGDPVLLTISTTTAGSLPDDQSDATTAKMLWTSNVASGSRKVTGKIASLFDGIDLSATVVAANSCGTAATEKTFTTSDQDFVTGIGNCITDTPGGAITFKAHVTSMVAPYSTSKAVTWTLTDDV
ncbi:MAG: hypothetical protein MUP16_09785 [Sedimentisphaerales bacterium]|nr:hypothetical protein [Sedimentisphaerales bacterium]